MEECISCGIVLDENVEYTNIPHTDVYYCDKCLHSNQPERLNETASKEEAIVRTQQ